MLIFDQQHLGGGKAGKPELRRGGFCGLMGQVSKLAAEWWFGLTLKDYIT
jgi:hypothetical protein